MTKIATKSDSSRIALLISNVMNPLFVAVPTFLLIALRTAPNVAQALLWWAVTVVGLSATPLFFILSGVRQGTFTDPDLSQREQRIIPLLFGLLCTAAVFLALFFLHADRRVIAAIVAVLIGGVITLLITRYWKISLHLVGVAGSTTVLTLVYGPIFLLLTPLVVLVGWARWRVQAHTPLQAVAGAALATFITVATFALFRLF